MSSEARPDLDAILSRCDAASPGPWTLSLRSPSGGTHAAAVRTPWGLPVASWLRWGTPGDKLPKTADTLLRWGTPEYFFHPSDEDRDLPEEDRHPEPCCDCGPYAEAYRREEADLRFIAAARSDVPALLDEVAALRRAAEHVLACIVDHRPDGSLEACERWGETLAAAEGLRRALDGAPGPDEEGL